MGLAGEVRGFFRLGDGDDVTAGHNNTCRLIVAEIIQAPDDIWLAIFGWAGIP
jgi:hypothetical protein